MTFGFKTSYLEKKPSKRGKQLNLLIYNFFQNFSKIIPLGIGEREERRGEENRNERRRERRSRRDEYYQQDREVN